MQKITPFLWFDGNALAAMKFYVSIFSSWRGRSAGGKKTKIINTNRFQIEGREFIAFNGGPQFKFNEAISMFVDCKNQAEVDELWEKLSAGGEKSRCGWLKDKFGLSWQIIPTVLGEMLNDKDDQKSERVLQAMLTMSKIDIAGLKQAYDQKSKISLAL